MDIVASAQAAATLAGMFLEIVQVTKHVIENMKGARAGLVERFTRAERIRLNLELFRSLTNKLSDPIEETTALLFNESVYRIIYITEFLCRVGLGDI
jgi:methyl-accepting chemotaxis protein